MRERNYLHYFHKNESNIALCRSACPATRSVFYYRRDPTASTSRLRALPVLRTTVRRHRSFTKVTSFSGSGHVAQSLAATLPYGSVCKISTVLMRKYLYSSLRDPGGRFPSSRKLYHPGGRDRTARDRADPTDERLNPCQDFLSLPKTPGRKTPFCG